MEMMMELVNGKIVLGRKNCQCGDGTTSTPIPCPECNGSGKGKRGKERGCKKCYGYGKAYDHDNRSVCKRCNGAFENHEPETLCDYLPKDIFPAMTIKVYYTNTMTLGEKLIGLGCVYSVQDYGTAWDKRDDAALIADVKKTTDVQATKIAKDDGTIADHIGIFVSQGGYTVKPVFKE